MNLFSEAKRILKLLHNPVTTPFYVIYTKWYAVLRLHGIRQRGRRMQEQEYEKNRDF